MNTTPRSILIMSCSTALGAALSALLLTPSPAPQRPKDELGELRQRLALTRAQLKRRSAPAATLEVSALTDALGAHSATLDPTTLSSSSASVSMVSSATTGLADARIGALEAELARALRGDRELTDAEMQAHLNTLEYDFDQALARGDAESALKIMMALGDLDPRAFPSLAKIWEKMRGAKWLGLTPAQQRLWFRPEIFHWALSSSELGLEGKSKSTFQLLALRLLGDYESDPKKKSASLLSFLAQLEAPLPPGAKDEKRLGRGWQRNRDPYRGAIDQLARLSDAEASRALVDLATSLDLPKDVRYKALAGLGRQQDLDSERVLQSALQDPDPTVQRFAQIALVRRNPPASGLLVTKIGKKNRFPVSPGSIITRCNGRPIRNDRDLQRALKKGRGAIPLEINDRGVIRKITVNGGKKLDLKGESIKAR